MDKRRTVEVRKTTIFVIVINGLQIAMMAVILVLVFMGHARTLTRTSGRVLAVIAALIVSSGAYFDIRDALNTRSLLLRSEDMDSTIRNMAAMNNSLRAQRHDFLNHLQVVYSLIEMQDYTEANRYIEQVYGKIHALSRAMKTANPAVNALLQVKLAAAEKAGIPVTLEILSDWRELPLEGWEMCKVLSNLIDNALEKLAETSGERRLRIRLEEDLHGYRFDIANNGSPIPPELQENIFQPGFTTKGSGHGMGLYIARSTLTRAGGTLTVRSDERETVFSGTLPKAMPPQE